MKKKTMQALFLLLFVVGVVVGYLLPGDFRTLAKKPLEAGIFDVPKKLGQLELETDYYKYTILAETETGSLQLIRIDDKIPTHAHPKENRFAFIYKGRAKANVGNVAAEVWQGQIVAVPAGVPHSFERIGDSPVEMIVFSSMPFGAGDSVFWGKG